MSAASTHAAEDTGAVTEQVLLEMNNKTLDWVFRKYIHTMR